MPVLAAHVTVFNRKGIMVAFAPGDEPPPWAAKLITNPKAWATPPAEDTDASNPSPVSDGGGGAPPALAGPDSGRDRWADYARSCGVFAGDDDKRDEIVAALRRAGVPVE